MRIINYLFNKKKTRGVSLLEVSLTITLGLIMMGTAAYYQGGSIQKSKESSLKQTLIETRKAIDAYYKNNGKYPEKLENLTSGDFIYLRNYPYDPVAQTNCWIIIKENGHTAVSSETYTGSIFDIRSTLKQYNNM